MAGPTILNRAKVTSTTTGTGTYSLGSAASNFTDLSGVGNGNTCFYYAVDNAGGGYEGGIGTYASSGPTLARTTVIASSNSNNAVSWSAGTRTIFVTPVAEAYFPYMGTSAPPVAWEGRRWWKTDEAREKIYYSGAWMDANAGAIPGDPGQVQGRLTLETGVPVSTSDQTAKTNVYFTPYNGNRVTLYNGSAWISYGFSELTLALGTVTSGVPYDVFLANVSGTLTLEKVAWTNDTTRATALVLQDGVYVKTGDTARRYLGSFRTTSTTTTEDSAAKRYVFQADVTNRVPRTLIAAKETANTWNYTSASYRQANANTANQLDIMIGLADVYVEAYVQALAASGSGTLQGSIGIGVDSTSVNSALVMAGPGLVNTNAFAWHAAYRGTPGIGRHYFAWLEYGNASTITWYGDNNIPTIFQCGIHGMAVL